jgi:hypothetical protein
MGLRSGVPRSASWLTLLNRRSDWADCPLALNAATPMNTPSMGKVERISLRKIAGLLPPLLPWQKLRCSLPRHRLGLGASLSAIASWPAPMP